jgi:hypothetical protein
MGRWLLASVGAVCLAVGTAAAGNITISITTTTEVRDGTLHARVKVTNSGDEAAHSVVPVLRFREWEARGTVRPAVGPGESMEQQLSVEAGTLGEGRWPYSLAIDYADGNQYPFQALHVGLLTVGSPLPAKVVVPEVKAGALDSSGSVQVRVKNLTGAERKASLTMIVPDGIEAPRPTEEVGLGAYEEKTLSLPLLNRTALAGSRYPVFVAVQYDDGTAHHAALSQGLVEILARQSFFQRTRSLLWVGAGVLIAAWLAVVLRGALVRRPGRAQPGS